MMKNGKEPLLKLNLDQPSRSEAEESRDDPEAGDSESAAAQPAADVPSFATVEGKPWLLADILRVFLILLSLVVAAGFVLVLLPQPAVDRMAQGLEARRGNAQPERIAFLYLGDELRDSEFHIRGVVRNITAAPIEQLDAAVRLYAHDGTLLQTTVVRMNKETIAPDEVAQFELVYPNYRMEIAKYSVDFLLRDGGWVSYKDMRAAR